jgi:transposase
MQLHQCTTPKLYIGIDVHKKSWRVHIKTDLFDHKEYTSPPDADQLYGYVSRHFPNYEVSVVYEACCTGFGAAREFINYGWDTKVVHTADVPKGNKQRYQKNDKIDARYLSERLRQGDLRSVYIPVAEQDYLKSLIRHRNQVVKNLRTQKNQIKSLLLYHSVTIPEEFDNPNWSKDFIAWLQELNWPYATVQFAMESKLRLYTSIYKEYLEAANKIRLYCRQHYKKDYYLLKSIPGIGGIVAGAILGELGDLRRFNTEAQLSNCIGVVPGFTQSGESATRSLGLTNRCKALLRSYLIESAWVAIRKDPEIQAYYRKHIGKNEKNVIVKVAHKMCRRILSVIKHERPYVINNKIETATIK